MPGGRGARRPRMSPHAALARSKQHTLQDPRANKSDLYAHACCWATSTNMSCTACFQSSPATWSVSTSEGPSSGAELPALCWGVSTSSSISGARLLAALFCGVASGASMISSCVPCEDVSHCGTVGFSGTAGLHTRLHPSVRARNAYRCAWNAACCCGETCRDLCDPSPGTLWGVGQGKHACQHQKKKRDKFGHACFLSKLTHQLSKMHVVQSKLHVQ